MDSAENAGMMGRSKRFVTGVLFGYGQQALVMLAGLWLTPFLLHRIGQHDYGLWLVGLQMLGYLALADIGVVALLPREVAYATGRAGGTADAADLPILVGRTARLVLYQTVIVVLAAASIWFLAPLHGHDIRGPVGVILITYTVLFPLRIFRALIDGLQDFGFSGKVQVLTWGVGTAATVLLILAGLRLYSLAIGWALTQILSAAAMAYRVLTQFPEVLPATRFDFSITGTWQYLKRGLWVSMTQIAQPLLNGIDIVIIGRVLGLDAVVPYTCTGKLLSVLSNQPQLLMQAAIPGLSEIKAGSPKEHVFRVTSALTQASLMISGAVVCIVLAVNQGFVGWWVGANQFGGKRLTVLLALAMLLRHWNVTAVYSMYCYGWERRLSVMCLLDGLVTFGASAVFIRWLGPIGGPLGSITSVCLVGLPANLIVVARESGVSVPVLLRPLWPWCWRCVLLAAVAAAAVAYRAPVGVLETAFAGGLTALVYAGIMLPVGQGSVLWPYLRPRLRPIRDFLYSASG